MPLRITLRANALTQLLSRNITSFQNVPYLTTIPKVLNQRSISRLRMYRGFHNCPLLYKKGGKALKKEKESSPASPVEASEIEDPFDFSTLEAGISRSIQHLQNDLSKLRTGGRFNPELLEALRVHLAKDDRTSVRLGELAQVLPKGGRTIMVVVGDAEHVKPIISAIQGAKDLNLQPQIDAHSSSQLNIPTPPPTKESRELALAAASKAGETASVGIRNARGNMQKRLRALELKKAVRPDDLKKAHKEMEKVVEKGNVEIKKTVDGARKTMEQS